MLMVLHYTLRILRCLDKSLRCSGLFGAEDRHCHDRPFCCLQDESCTTSVSNYTTLGAPLCLPSFQTDCSSLRQSPANLTSFRNFVLYGFTSCTLLDSWHQQRVETKPFVQNRVNEIRKNVHPDHWRHCPGIPNPAFETIGTVSESAVATRTGVARCRPCGEAKTNLMPEECSAELKTSALRSLNLVATDSEGDLLDLWYLIKTVESNGPSSESYWDIQEESQQHLNQSTNLTPEDLAHAEELWIMTAQRQLSQEKNFKAQKKQLNLFKDEKGIWRCGGRLSNAEIPYATKHPILLPRTHPLTKLIVRRAHERVCHNGVMETLTETRRSFWIPKGRSLIKCMIHRCVLCRRNTLQDPTTTTFPPPPLPTFRVKEDPAFSYTGVDFAGIRGSGAPDKVWICLFTCLVTRAVHLDIVSNQSTLT